MNLYFRLIRIFIKAFFKNKNGNISPFSSSEINFKVWPLDMDINLHMNNARYLSMMDLGRIYHMSRCGLMHRIIKEKWLPIVGKIDIRYIKSINAFEEYTLRTEISGHDEKYFTLTQTFLKGETPMAIAHVRGLFLDRKKNKIPPQKVIDYLNIK